jgi:hypothetical protein
MSVAWQLRFADFWGSLAASCALARLYGVGVAQARA